MMKTLDRTKEMPRKLFTDLNSAQLLLQQNLYPRRGLKVSLIKTFISKTNPQLLHMQSRRMACTLNHITGKAQTKSNE